MKKTALSLGLAALFGLASLAQAETAYVYDSSKTVVRDSSKSCVLNGHNKLSEKTAIVECHPDLLKAEAEPAYVAPAPEAPTEKLKTMTLNADAYFDFDKYNLKPAGKTALDGLVSEIAAYKVEQINVVGHTDSVGTEAYNQKLSERRANTVKEYLSSKGVNGSIINASGKGELQPVATNKTKEGRAQNRRVEVEVMGKR